MLFRSRTLVREGATIGAGCTIGNDLVIGRWAMVGMGSLVTKSIGDFELVVGSPAQAIGYVCRCGHPIARFARGEAAPDGDLSCSACGLTYRVAAKQISELNPPR